MGSMAGETGNQEGQARDRVGARIARGPDRRRGHAARRVPSRTALAAHGIDADERPQLPIPPHRRHQHRMRQSTPRDRHTRQGTILNNQSSVLNQSSLMRR